MLFDDFCHIVENNDEFKELIPVLQNCQIFQFKGRPHEVLPKEVKDQEDLLQNFFLPFPMIAVEDSATCVLIVDTLDNQRGMEGQRLFIEFGRADTDLDEFQNKPDMPNKFVDIVRGQGLCSIVFVTINRMIPLGQQYGLDASFRSGYVASPSVVVDTTEYVDQTAAKSFIRNASVAIQEIMFFNSSDYWIVEKTTGDRAQRRRAEKAISKGKIPRSDDRSLYTSMKPTEIRRKLRLPEVPQGESDASRKSPMAHDRRRHFRYLKNEKYKIDPKTDKERTLKMSPKGEPYYTSTIVPATWIGPSSARVGNHIYIVRTDI